MARHNRKKRHVSPFYTFAGVWLMAACFLPMYRLWALLLTLGLSSFCAYLMGKHAAKKEREQKAAPAVEAQPAQTSQTKTAAGACKDRRPPEELRPGD